MHQQINYKTMGFGNLINNKENTTSSKINNKKMEILKGRDYFLSIYHHVVTIILQQLLPFVDLKNTHNHL
jgi:hypothetical protein